MPRKIVTNYDAIRDYSKAIAEDTQQFEIIVRNMAAIVEALESRGWSGFAAQTFISNATAYLAELKDVREKLKETALRVQNGNKYYTSRIDDYFDAVKARRDMDEQS